MNTDKNLSNELSDAILKISLNSIYSQMADAERKKSISLTVPEKQLENLKTLIKKFNDLTDLKLSLSGVVGNAFTNINKKLLDDISKVEKIIKEHDPVKAINSRKEMLEKELSELEKLKNSHVETDSLEPPIVEHEQEGFGDNHYEHEPVKPLNLQNPERF